MHASYFSQNRDGRDIRLRAFGQVYFEEAVFQFRLRILVIHRNLDGNFSAEMSISTLDAVVGRNTTAGGSLALQSRDDQHAFGPGDLRINSVHARDLDKDHDLFGTLADIDSRSPGRGLAPLL